MLEGEREREREKRLNPFGRGCVSVTASLDLVEKLQIFFLAQSTFGFC